MKRLLSLSLSLSLYRARRRRRTPPPLPHACAHPRSRGFEGSLRRARLYRFGFGVKSPPETSIRTSSPRQHQGLLSCTLSRLQTRQNTSATLTSPLSSSTQPEGSVLPPLARARALVSLSLSLPAVSCSPSSQRAAGSRPAPLAPTRALS